VYLPLSGADQLFFDHHSVLHSRTELVSPSWLHMWTPELVLRPLTEISIYRPESYCTCLQERGPNFCTEWLAEAQNSCILAPRQGHDPALKSDSLPTNHSIGEIGGIPDPFSECDRDFLPILGAVRGAVCMAGESLVYLSAGRYMDLLEEEDKGKTCLGDSAKVVTPT
jgi:hypothetical protein